MFLETREENPLIKRVRAILLTEQHEVLFIKRVKPDKSTPYWVAPGGGVEDDDSGLLAALHRELDEELGAKAEVLKHGFVLRHHKAEKNLEEHFFVCRLLDYDLSLRNGPEFNDPKRGDYIPDAIELKAEAIGALNLRTEELRDWLLENLDTLREL
jgi:8-oxo-dGTP pyrophosphatase MutT (NUDIX family)